MLKVKINKISLANQGVIATGPNISVMNHNIEAFASTMVLIENEKTIFNDKVHIPLNPIISVTLEGELVPSGIPDAHSSNIDTKIITEGQHFISQALLMIFICTWRLLCSEG